MEEHAGRYVTWHHFQFGSGVFRAGSDQPCPGDQPLHAGSGLVDGDLQHRGRATAGVGLCAQNGLPGTRQHRRIEAVAALVLLLGEYRLDLQGETSATGGAHLSLKDQAAPGLHRDIPRQFEGTAFLGVDMDPCRILSHAEFRGIRIVPAAGKRPCGNRKCTRCHRQKHTQTPDHFEKTPKTLHRHRPPYVTEL